MAAIAPTITDVSPTGDGSALQVVWTPVTSAGSDTCNPVYYPKHSTKSIQVSGTFGGSSTALNGSNDGTNYAALNNPAGSAIAITAAKVSGVLENTAYIQPVNTGGTASSVSITMLLVAPTPPRH